DSRHRGGRLGAEIPEGNQRRQDRRTRRLRGELQRRRCEDSRRCRGRAEECEELRKCPPDTGRAVQGGSVMARKDNGANDESPEPLVSKGTAGEGIDDLGVPVDDEVIEDETTADEAESDDEATATGASKGSTATAKKESDESGATDGLDDVPFELAEDTPDPDELPETGLVSEFVDVGNRQAA